MRLPILFLLFCSNIFCGDRPGPCVSHSLGTLARLMHSKTKPAYLERLHISSPVVRRGYPNYNFRNLERGDGLSPLEVQVRVLPAYLKKCIDMEVSHSIENLKERTYHGTSIRHMFWQDIVKKIEYRKLNIDAKTHKNFHYLRIPNRRIPEYPLSREDFRFFVCNSLNDRETGRDNYERSKSILIPAAFDLFEYEKNEEMSDDKSPLENALEGTDPCFSFYDPLEKNVWGNIEFDDYLKENNINKEKVSKAYDYFEKHVMKSKRINELQGLLFSISCADLRVCDPEVNTTMNAILKRVSLSVSKNGLLNPNSHVDIVRFHGVPKDLYANFMAHVDQALENK